MSNELSDALHQIRELEEQVDNFKHRYKESEVWLACFTVLLTNKDSGIVNDAESADDAVIQYRERFQ